MINIEKFDFEFTENSGHCRHKMKGRT